MFELTNTLATNLKQQKTGCFNAW